MDWVLIIWGVGHMVNVNYPKEFLKILVVADNCTDNTFAVAQDFAKNFPELITVLERTDTKLRGKPYAVSYALGYIDAHVQDTHSVSIADADNIYDKEFFRVMNRHVNNGSEIIQGYLGIKNPYDNQNTISSTIAYATMARTYYNTRRMLGMTTSIGGTGFVMTRSVMDKIGWDMVSLTEDLEFATKCTLHGQLIDFAHDAITYDEKPTTLKASIVQRKRWMQGHFHVSFMYTWPLVKMLIHPVKSKLTGLIPKRSELLDYLIYVLGPTRVVIQAYMLASTIFLITTKGAVISNNHTLYNLSMTSRIVLFLSSIILYIITTIMAKIPVKKLYAIPYDMFIFNYAWYISTFQALKNVRSRHWVKTEHKVKV
jgi:cellulose synthase/poly-beta-1,6-N-acetylglucosamine synthase-like glycosyltransferase